MLRHTAALALALAVLATAQAQTDALDLLQRQGDALDLLQRQYAWFGDFLPISNEALVLYDPDNPAHTFTLADLSPSSIAKAISLYHESTALAQEFQSVASATTNDTTLDQGVGAGYAAIVRAREYLFALSSPPGLTYQEQGALLDRIGLWRQLQAVWTMLYISQ